MKGVFRMKTFLNFGLIILLTHSITAISNDPFPVDSESLEKLFQPVDQTMQDRLFEENQFSLKRATYFGKRHRIVKVNMDLLVDNGRAFVVNPFDDIQFIVNTAEIKVYGGGLSQRWVGNLLDPRLDLAEADIPVAFKKQLNTLGINISATRIVKPAHHFDKDTKVGITSDPNKEVITSKIYVSGKFPEYGVRYRLLPINQSADYHLIIELDNSKQLMSGKSAIAQQRRNAHLEFSERLNLEEAKSKSQKQGDLK